MEVLIAYSGAPPSCACCGESTLQFLAIDHVNGDGGAIRRRTGLNAGAAYYRFLKREGFPPGRQVLCHNCNLAKGFYGKCPHEVCQ